MGPCSKQVLSQKLLNKNANSLLAQALARVQGELEILSRERSSLMLEKQHFADEVGMQKALVSSALALKAQLKAQAEELICREEELQTVHRAAQRLQLQRDEEEAQIKKVTSICLFVSMRYAEHLTPHFFADAGPNRSQVGHIHQVHFMI